MKNIKRFSAIVLMLGLLIGCTYCYIGTVPSAHARILGGNSPLELMARGDFDKLSTDKIPVAAKNLYSNYEQFSQQQTQAHLKAYNEHVDKIQENVKLAQWREDLLATSKKTELKSEDKENLEKDLTEKLKENWTNALAELTAIHNLRERLDDLPNDIDEALSQKIIDKCIKIAEKYQAQDKGMDAYSKVFGLLEVLDNKKYEYTDLYDKLLRQAVLEATYVPDPNSETISWQEKRKDITPELLQTALLSMRSGYVEEPDFKKMTIKGLNYLITLAETKKLQEVFPQLNDEKKKNIWLTELKDLIVQNKEIEAKEYDIRYPIYCLEKITELNKKALDLPENVVIAEFAEGMFDAVDTYSHIVWPADVEAFMKDMKSEFSGIGVVIKKDDEGFLRIDSLLNRDSEAYRAGLEAGDRILNVDGEDIKNFTVEKSVGLITGPSGTKVTLTIQREGVDENWDVEVTRKSVHVPTVYGLYRDIQGDWQYMVDKADGIGYVRLTRFSDDTSASLRQTLKQLRKDENLKAVILDLRNNGGGYLHEAVNVVDTFVNDGRVVSTKYRDNQREEVKNATSKGTFDSKMPLVVLVNSMSASASEIVSGSLKDHERALLVGSQTFGKGSVQTIYGLAKDSKAQMKMTIAYYYLPEGRKVHRDPKDKFNKDYGVFPHKAVELTGEQFKEFVEVQRDAGILHRDDMPRDKQTWKIYNTDEMLKSDPQLNMAVMCLQAQLLSETRSALANQ
ncbi:MAG: S41 family peptidase [Phycisphaerae bacterium]|nr:S41 family peptidase [Phycisphaerae bacterium]